MDKNYASNLNQKELYNENKEISDLKSIEFCAINSVEISTNKVIINT